MEQVSSGVHYSRVWGLVGNLLLFLPGVCVHFGSSFLFSGMLKVTVFALVLTGSFPAEACVWNEEAAEMSEW